MRIQLMSDVHLEFHRDGGEAFLRDLDPTGVDLLVIAGDLGMGRDLKAAFDVLCRKYLYVAFVLDNHEYYKSDPRQTHERARAAVWRHPNLVWLDETVYVQDGVRVVGTSLWFPYDTGEEVDRDRINDFRLIRDFAPWVFQKNERAQEFLRREVRRGDVVVTHHLPSHKCTHPKYAGSPLNKYFVCDVEKLIADKQPRYWLYGHTHEKTRFNIGETELVCNPFGYVGVEPEANAAFDDRLILEIP